MSAQKPIRPDRLERMSRAMLGLALLAGVVWVLTDGGGLPLELGFSSLGLGWLGPV